MSRHRLQKRFTGGAKGGNLDGGPGMGYVAIDYAGGCHGKLDVLVNYDRKGGRWVVSFKEWNLTDY
ncbi:hypothetical protein GCM10022242_38120 [Nocardioides panacisoli]|uniref:Uncharacterized protein n=2 Tax=Nocardioides panacisoli TaxID=627624 RepID=A0ABP7J4G1_9ACTN